MKRIFTYLLFIFFFANYMLFLGNTSGSLPEFSGAPGEDTCGAAGCHNVMPNQGMAVASIDFNGAAAEYTPGDTYPIEITIANPQNPKNGFQITALDIMDESVGSWTPGSGTIIVTGSAPNNRSYVTHNAQGSGQSTWMMEWTAPQNYAGPITFYAAVNDSNGNNNKNGDDVYTINMEITSPFANTNSISNLAGITAFPNPFTDQITISMELANTTSLEIGIYNRLGVLVKKAHHGELASGNHKILIDGFSDLPKDLYFARVKEISGGVKTLKLIKL